MRYPILNCTGTFVLDPVPEEVGIPVSYVKSRHLIVGAAATLAAVGSFALPAGVLAHTDAASISKVAIKLVTPSTVNSQGSFELTVTGTGTFDSFDLYRRASNLTGSTFALIASKVNGKTYKDTEQDSFGATQYEMVPFSGKNGTGTEGAATYSVGPFYPTTWPQDEVYYQYSGSGGTVSSSKYFGGSAWETTSSGAGVEFFNGCDWNDGLVIGTGSSGGIGTVYLNGTTDKIGTINFYSSKVTGTTIAFKYGTGTAECNQFYIVQTGKGAGGGSNMWFTGVVETSEL